MIVRDHLVDMLREDLQTLVPLVKAAVQALDKPGSRVLRRKLDSKFETAVWAFNGIQRADRPISEAVPDFIRYDRVTLPIRRASWWKTGDAGGSDRAPAPESTGLRLVVDNASVSSPRDDISRQLTALNLFAAWLAKAAPAIRAVPIADDGGDHAA